mmetsp:Transcript_28720/g.93421  ORF Transcript_28720/g.93421 Transcript_28720/m.93421 type:complete len:294 (+) Transcript_28720:703-1584(+)
MALCVYRCIHAHYKEEVPYAVYDKNMTCKEYDMHARSFHRSSGHMSISSLTQLTTHSPAVHSGPRPRERRGCAPPAGVARCQRAQTSCAPPTRRQSGACTPRRAAAHPRRTPWTGPSARPSPDGAAQSQARRCRASRAAASASAPRSARPAAAAAAGAAPRAAPPALSRRARRCDPTAACASGCAARPAPPPRAGAMGRSRRRSWRRPWQSRSPPCRRGRATRPRRAARAVRNTRSRGRSRRLHACARAGSAPRRRAGSARGMLGTVAGRRGSGSGRARGCRRPSIADRTSRG